MQHKRASEGKRTGWLRRFAVNPRYAWQKTVIQIMLALLSLIIAAPVFIMVYRYVPDFILEFDGHPFRLDHLLTGILIFAAIRFLLGFIDHLIVYVFLVATFSFLILHFTGWYSYQNVMHRYSDLLSFVESNPVKIPFLKDEKMTIRNARQIRDAIDFRNPDVRNYAVHASKANFSDPYLYREHGNIIRYFSIFAEVVQWNYIPDPVGEEYYAKASETIHHLSGDCDDYSILMAACIKAVGGEVRLIHTKSHLYPEVKICHQRDFDKIVNLIKRQLFLKESLGGSIYYHIDRDDYIWLNFDYTTRYPGGPFMDEAILGILVI
jgi:hypothetical protein